jgi:ABC-type multidrug transport system fused ATPase/permease subunit
VLFRICQLLSPAGRRGLCWLSGALVLSALVEVAQIAAVMQVMALVSDPGILGQTPWLARIYQDLGFTSPRSFTLFAGVAVILFLALGYFFAALTAWLSLRYVWAQEHDLSCRLLERYLRLPLAQLARENTTLLGRNVLARSIAEGILGPFTQILARVVSVALIVAVLVWIDARVALIGMALVALGYTALHRFTRLILARISEEAHQAGGRQHQAALEALQAHKEIRVLGKEEHFLARYRRQSELATRCRATGDFLGLLPRYFLETLAFGGLLGLTLYLVGRGHQRILPMLSLYAMAGYRLIPAVHHIFYCLSRIRFHQPGLEEFHRALARAPATPSRASAPLRLEHGIALKGVTFAYAAEPVLRDVSLTIPRGSWVALVGSTGAGKTTLLDLLLGLLEPSSGSVSIDGRPLDEHTLASWQRAVGYVPQTPYLLDDTVLRNIAFGVPEEAIDRARAKRAARLAGIHGFITERLPQGYHTVLGERGALLSGGQRQRLCLARALYPEPQVLVLDEATNALDGVTEASVLENLRGLEGLTVILVAHRLATVRHCQEIFVLAAGRLVARGGYQELLATCPEFAALARQEGEMTVGTG